MKLKLTAVLLALAVLTGCATGFGFDTPAAGQTADEERSATLESPAPRRHLGNLSNGGVYDN